MSTATLVEARPIASGRLATPQRLARLTGALYLVLAVLGMLGPLALESLLVPGDAAETVANLNRSQTLFTVGLFAWLVIVAVDVAIAGTLYLLLAPAGRRHALFAAVFRLVYVAVVAARVPDLFTARRLASGAAGDPAQEHRVLAALTGFDDAFLVALVFFGVHLVLLGTLLHRSRYVPRLLGATLVAAGVGYVVDSTASLLVHGYGGPLSAVLLTPAVVGEIGLALWLLVKGVRVGSER